MNVTLVCVDAGGGHACGLSLGLRKYCNLTTVWENHNLHGLDHIEPQALFGFKHLPLTGDILIIVSIVTINELEWFFEAEYNRFLRGYKQVKIIITNGKIIEDPPLYNAKIKGMEVFAHLCKIAFRGGLPTKEYYQPFDLSHVEIKKNDKLTIAHSPFCDLKKVQKGTEEIEREVKKKYGDSVNLDVIIDTPWEEAMIRKARSHLFIDQVYNSADRCGVNVDHHSIGKSGIEAMLLESLVFTRGEYIGRKIPAPPVVWIGRKNFIDLVDYYIEHPEEKEAKIKEQKEWALKYTTYDFASRNVLGI